MRKARLRSIVKKKFKMTTDFTHKFSVPQNILDRDFKPGTLGALWVSDITYIKMQQGMVVSDNCNRSRRSKSNRNGFK
ncbi:hypothetical protein [Sphingobacterium sp. HSC-15S19]|uniref:hypothetical protein n=1 Tax=Sphingobacterium sp. HSC-15S19 TaxID=2910971 RepID=UPI003D1F9429